MFAAAFLAGSFLPFSSEAVMAALQLAGLPALPLFVWGTLGNTLGSCFNYWLGSMGDIRLIEKYAHVRQDRLEKQRHLAARYGPAMGLLSWIPILGTVITVALGLMRVSFWPTLLAIAAGKALRYAFVVSVVSEI